MVSKAEKRLLVEQRLKAELKKSKAKKRQKKKEVVQEETPETTEKYHIPPTPFVCVLVKK